MIIFSFLQSIKRLPLLISTSSVKRKLLGHVRPLPLPTTLDHKFIFNHKRLVHKAVTLTFAVNDVTKTGTRFTLKAPKC